MTIRSLLMFDDWYWLSGMVCNLSYEMSSVCDMDALVAFG